MTYRATTETTPDNAAAAGQMSAPRLHGAFSHGEDSDAYSDVFVLKLRLGQLENENLALKTQVNQLIMSLSRTLLRDAVKS